VRDLEAIAASFLQVDNDLEDLRDRHHVAGEAEERDRVAGRQKLNEQAWFVLAWGQFEAEISEACRDAIRLGMSHEEWRQRRAWDLCDPEGNYILDSNKTYIIIWGLISIT